MLRTARIFIKGSSDCPNTTNLRKMFIPVCKLCELHPVRLFVPIRSGMNFIHETLYLDRKADRSMIRCTYSAASREQMSLNIACEGAV